MSDDDPDITYTVNRMADGAQVRAELTLDQASSERDALNAQARLQVGMTPAEYDERGQMVRSPTPVYASMHDGDVSTYEVRTSSGLVVTP